MKLVSGASRASAAHSLHACVGSERGCLAGVARFLRQSCAALLVSRRGMVTPDRPWRGAP